ncbi:hypothetical protein [Burkholderia arboris]|uniref:hypothetical protein n=1 Tax=Burkholderia arboris TaxID=488730 RepID=UPI00158DEEAE|nr:hypothetical protein [Burkholderia arboris]
MVSSGRNAGFDEPFAYNVATNSFITISGVTSGNVPLSPTTSGFWTPPTIAVVGTKILITHPGFSGTGSNFFGVIDISTPATPAWSSSNLATNPLTAVPTSVANFNNRAWFAVGNTLDFSDPLNPLTRTNATQAVTVGDTTPITAQSGLPIQTTTAGVIGALVVFKASQVWQITGDPTTNNLALNYISLTTGCVAPRSIVQGPFGIFFAGVDAPYILNFLGTLVPLSSRPGTDFPADLQVPFQNTTQASRISASFAGNIYRVCVPTLIQGIQQTNDYWYDIRRKRWTGPHSFSYDCASQYGESFVLSSAAQGAALFVSTTIPSSNSSYLDAGASFMCHLRSSDFPKTGHMQQIQVVESTIELGATGTSVVFNLTALNDQNNTIASPSSALPAKRSTTPDVSSDDCACADRRADSSSAMSFAAPSLAFSASSALMRSISASRLSSTGAAPPSNSSASAGSGVGFPGSCELRATISYSLRGGHGTALIARRKCGAAFHASQEGRVEQDRSVEHERQRIELTGLH